MALGKMTPRFNRVLGVDASTQSFAFALFEDKKLIKYGEILFEGKSVFDRLADAQRKVYAMRSELEADLVVIEGATFVQNKKTVILLAYCFGAIISALAKPGVVVEEVSPMTWQNAIGNKRFSKAEKDAVFTAYPGKSKSWYDNYIRETRKKRTMDWVKESFGVEAATDNISDAIALGAVRVRK